MKTSINISVKNPCSKKFDIFMKTKNGGFCSTCKKEVTDFTLMSEKELISYFGKSKGKTCGRFTSSQLKTYETATLPKVNYWQKSIGALGVSLLALCASPEVTAQETQQLAGIVQIETLAYPENNVLSLDESYTVKGTVLDEENLPLPGVNIVLKGTTEGVVSDLDGKFEFPRALEEGDVLVFSYLGYITKQYKVKPSESSTLDITIVFEAADVELMGEVVVGEVYSSKRNIFQKFFDLFR